MNHNIETIIEELYNIDPTLKAHESELRALVVALVDSKPDVSVDDTFARELRARLLARDASSVHLVRESLGHNFSWWAFRLVPFGMVALLLFFVQKPQPQNSENGVMMMQKIAGNSLNVVTQKPGSQVAVDFVQLERGGYVVVREDKGGVMGEILGVSRLVEAGRTEGFSVPLSRPLRDGEMMYAALYADDGDGVFNTSKDSPVLDSMLGVPMYMSFSISLSAMDGGVSR